MNISVKFGTFNVVENKSNNGVSLYNGDRKVIDLPNVNWWDKDAVERLMYDNEAKIRENDKDPKDALIERLNERIIILENEQNKINVNESNIIELLETANNVVKESISDAKDRGFCSSRISQVVNKLQKRNF